ncbi:MAG TPA: VOC family protein [Propionibacteriaceae bacterium]|jgi:catechol 2,3-dioxygenase-like lactoylglutathione lyase family enzyme|nr:VOC family protein [Propionibacteriaceae bacterium]
MLSSYTPVPTLAVADLTKARSFYQDALGLTVQRDGPGGVAYTCGTGNLFVYESAYAGTNQATAVTFDLPVSDFDAEVDALRAKGIEFMTFEMDGFEWTDGVASMGGEGKAVWFSDPDGNILNLSTGEM